MILENLGVLVVNFLISIYPDGRKRKIILLFMIDALQIIRRKVRICAKIGGFNTMILDILCNTVVHFANVNLKCSFLFWKITGFTQEYFS